MADVTMSQIWRTTLDALDSDGIPVQQRAFLSLARLVGLLDETALIAVPNDFTKEIVETKLRQRVTETLGAQLGHEVRLAVTVDHSLADPDPGDADGDDATATILQLPRTGRPSIRATRPTTTTGAARPGAASSTTSSSTTTPTRSRPTPTPRRRACCGRGPARPYPSSSS